MIPSPLSRRSRPRDVVRSVTDHPTALAAARERLVDVNQWIAAHPLNSTDFRRARALVGTMPEADRTEIESALRDRGLPSLGKQTKMLALGVTSLARLNRKRIRLEKRVAAFG